MSTPSLSAQIEAILYLKGRPVGLNELCELARAEPQAVQQALLALRAGYAKRDTALELSLIHISEPTRPY